MNKSENISTQGTLVQISSNESEPTLYQRNHTSVSFSSSSVNGDRKKPNPFSFSKQEIDYSVGTVVVTKVDVKTGKTLLTNTFSGVLGAQEIEYRTFNPEIGAVPSSSTLTSTYNSAISRFYDAVRNCDLNAVVSLAELSELHSLKRSLGPKRFGQASRALRSTPILGAATLVADAWLLWHLMLEPMVKDAYSLLQFASSRFMTRQVKGSARSSYALVYPYGGQGGLVERFDSVKYKFGATFRVSNPQLFDASRLGALNPTLVAWELVPLSFVFDYFYNVGGYLQNLEASFGAGLDFLYGYQTETWKVDSRTLYSRYSWTDTLGIRTTVSPALKNAYRRRYCKRTLLSSFPKPRLPSLDLDLGSQQLLTGAALLQSIFLRR